MTLYDQCESRGLNASDRQHIALTAVFKRIEAGGIHAENPVSDGTRHAGVIQIVEFVLSLERLKTFADRLVGERRYPQPPDRTANSGFLHHPTLDQLAFLPGITTVDNFIGVCDKSLYDVELSANAFVVDNLYAELRGQHGQRSERPSLPERSVVVWFFEAA